MKLRGSLDGLPVLDAEEALQIRVIRDDIDYTKRRDPECCAFAAACVRELHVDKARVHMSRVYVLSSDGTHWVRYQMPTAAQREIVSFDRGGTFEPGTYYFPPLPARQRAAGRREYKASLRGRRRRKIIRMPSHETEGVRAKSPLLGQPIEQVP